MMNSFYSRKYIFRLLALMAFFCCSMAISLYCHDHPLFSYGFEGRNYQSGRDAIFLPIIKRGTIAEGIPTLETHYVLETGFFVPCEKHQSAVEIKVYEGEIIDRPSQNNWLFGSVILNDIQPTSTIQVYFEYSSRQAPGCYCHDFSGFDCNFCGGFCAINRLRVTAREVPLLGPTQNQEIDLQSQNMATVEFDLTEGSAFFESAFSKIHNYAYSKRFEERSEKNAHRHDYETSQLCLPPPDLLLLPDGSE